MLAPSAFDTTGPAAVSASAISRVVVVLPFVADTRITSRCCASRPSRSGSSLSATRPPITDPLPRPAARDTAAAALPAVTASLARGDNGSVLPAIVLDPPCVSPRPAYRCPARRPHLGTTGIVEVTWNVRFSPCETARSPAVPDAFVP